MRKTQAPMIIAAKPTGSTGTGSLGFQGLAVVLSAAFGLMSTGCNSGSPMSPDRHEDASVHMALRSAPAEDDHPGSARSLAEVFTGAGDINAAIGAFRDELGALNPNQPG